MTESPMQAARSLSDWLAFIERQHPKSIELGLERVRKVAQRMGLMRPAKQVITVGGTNGKGSTVAFIEAIARAAGWKVGAYTSPHLLAYNERVRIDGRDATDAELIMAFEIIDAAARGEFLSPSLPGRAVGVSVRREREARPLIEPASAAPSVHLAPHPDRRAVAAAFSAARTGNSQAQRLIPEGQVKTEAIPLTYFEYGTLAALCVFQRSQLDLAILEVGLGGRLDAVNLVDADVAVITTVDLDHQDYLGDDREAIGFEKAGIARPGQPLVLGEDDPPASVLRHAYAIGASAIRANCDFFFESMLRPAHEQPEPAWRWREVGYAVELSNPTLAAPVQLRNAATAIAALRALGKPLPKLAIAQGIANASVPGRLQRIERDGIQIVLDVGHNPQAARELATWLRQARAPGRTSAVFAALGDKDLHGLVAAVAPHIDHWFLAGLDGAGPRGLGIDVFAERLHGTAAGTGTRHPSVDLALVAAQARAQPGDRILVFGSFHTVAAALQLLQGQG